MTDKTARVVGRLRARWHRARRRPHDWKFWTRLEDGQRPSMPGWPSVPNILIVERCSFQPSCRAVRSFPYHSILPESVIPSLTAALLAPNPYRGDLT